MGADRRLGQAGLHLPALTSLRGQGVNVTFEDGSIHRATHADVGDLRWCPKYRPVAKW